MKNSIKSDISCSKLMAGLVALTFAVSAFAGPSKTVVLPPRSHNQLAAAVAAAGPGGTVLVKSGDHTEDGTVVVEIPVKIVGEPGANLRCGTSPSPLTIQLPLLIPASLIPTLHIKGTEDVVVRGLTFLPVHDAANCAVVVEHSDRVQIVGNSISGFQSGVIVQFGNEVLIRNNTIACSPLWLADPRFLLAVVGINVVNGHSAKLTDNSVTGAFFGIFGNDRHGQMLHNTAAGCATGFILCHSQPVLSLNDVPVFAETPATGWQVQNNNALGDGIGYLVIDGANHNLLANNNGAGNQLDMRLVGYEDFYGVGFVMPTSSDNLITAGSHKQLTIMDCGENNTVLGDWVQLSCP